MSRLFVEARAPISFNLFSSACKRRSISPVCAEVNDGDNAVDVIQSVFHFAYRYAVFPLRVLGRTLKARTKSSASGTFVR